MTILLLKGNHEISILNLAHSTEKYSEWPAWIEIDPIVTQCDPIQKENWHNFEKKLSEYFLENFFWKWRLLMIINHAE